MVLRELVLVVKTVRDRWQCVREGGGVSVGKISMMRGAWHKKAEEMMAGAGKSAQTREGPAHK